MNLQYICTHISLNACRNGKVVGLVSEEVILFALGTGNYDELICASSSSSSIC